LRGDSFAVTADINDAGQIVGTSWAGTTYVPAQLACIARYRRGHLLLERPSSEVGCVEKRREHFFNPPLVELHRSAQCSGGRGARCTFVGGTTACSHRPVSRPPSSPRLLPAPAASLPCGYGSSFSTSASRRVRQCPGWSRHPRRSRHHRCFGCAQFCAHPLHSPECYRPCGRRGCSIRPANPSFGFWDHESYWVVWGVLEVWVPIPGHADHRSGMMPITIPG